MPPEDFQQQPDALEQGIETGTQTNGESNVGQAEQTPFKRVSAEEAATLPYDELKRRMKEERRLYEEGLLPDTTEPESGGDDFDEDDSHGTSGQGDESRPRSGGEGGGTTEGDPKLQELLKQAQDRAAQLERERAQEKQQQEQANLDAQHRRVEEAIAQMPEQVQALARQDYANRLRGAALNDYYGFLQQREQAVRQAEIAQARQSIPNMLSELADSVAQRHGLRNADPLKQYVTSKEFKTLLEASQTEDALMAAAANAGQWMEFLAVQQSTELAANREQRRQRAAANPRVMRDTPNGGVPTAGGDMDLVRRINTMSREEFFAWKKQQIKEAQASA